MVPWLEAAASSMSVEEACRRVGVSVAQYLLARRNDQAFDEGALVFDQIVDLMIREVVRQGALAGDPAMTRIYLSKIALPAFTVPFASWRRRPKPPPENVEPLPPHVADAMIRAALEAVERGPDDDDEDDDDG